MKFLKASLLLLLIANVSFAQRVFKYRAYDCFYTVKDPTKPKAWKKEDGINNLLVVLDEPRDKINIYSDTLQNLSIIKRYDGISDSVKHVSQYNMDCIDQDNKKCAISLITYRGKNGEHLVTLVVDYALVTFRFDMLHDDNL